MFQGGGLSDIVGFSPLAIPVSATDTNSEPSGSAPYSHPYPQILDQLYIAKNRCRRNEQILYRSRPS